MRNTRFKKQILKKLAEKTDSYMTIQFDTWGTDPYSRSENIRDGFNDHERCMLSQAFEATVEGSKQMYEAGKSRFKDHLNDLRLYFGLIESQSDFQENVDYIIHGVNMMHAVLGDNTQVLTFVDSRDTLRGNFDIEYLAPLGFNKLCGEKAFVVYEDKTANQSAAWVRILDKANRLKDNAPHVGSGYRVYIGYEAVKLNTTLYARMHLIYHEMTHKVLDTTDLGHNGLLLYGQQACYMAAKENRYRALEIADSWAFFFHCFHPGGTK